jgi:hypothetical protein
VEGDGLRDGAALEDAEPLNWTDGVGEIDGPLGSAGDAAAEAGAVCAAAGDADTDTADGLGLA